VSASRPTSRALGRKRRDELRVSLEDKLHNARAILLDFRLHRDALWIGSRAARALPVRWYHRGLYNAFADRSEARGEGALPFLAEFGRTVDEIDRRASPLESSRA
jgi:hypothetical protein